MTNTEELNKRIKASGLKKSYIAKVLGIASGTLSQKISNRRGFRSLEMDALCDLLGIDNQEREAIFFVEKVAESAT